MAAPAYKAHQVAGTTSTPLTINKPTCANGDLLLAIIGAYGLSSYVITPPAGWTLVRRTDPVGSGRAITLTYYRVVDGTEGASFTWTCSVGNESMIGAILTYEHVGIASPIDCDNGATYGASSNFICPTITTTVENVLAVWAWHRQGNQTLTLPGGVTERCCIWTGSGDLIRLYIADELIVAPGATGTRTATSAAGNKSTNHSQGLTPSGGDPYYVGRNRWGRLGRGLTKAEVG